MGYDLKPCPFCGGKAEVFQKGFGTNSDNKSVVLRFLVCCVKCNVYPPGTEGRVEMKLQENGELVLIKDERETAVDAWNRRKDGGQEE